LCDPPQQVGLDSLIQIGNSSGFFERAGLPASVFSEVHEGFLSRRRYDWGEALVRGGISTIHEARERSIGRPVAIRVMQPTSQKSARTVLRFVREAQIMGQLQHPQIPPVYEIELNDEGQLYYTTRAIEGDSLGGIIDRLRARDAETLQRWTLPSLITVFQRAADAIAYAHSRGVMHRAIRPDSIVAGDFGEVLVLAWTFARLFSEGMDPVQRQVYAAGHAILPGLSPYTAPEIASGTGVYDERVDVYSLGAVLYSLLSLASPFGEMSDPQLAERITSVGVPPLRAPGHPHPELEHVVMRALSISPEQRQPSVRHLQAEVAACQDAAGAPMKKWGWGFLSGKTP
jgi:serine/threonine protein kinase